MVLSKSGKTRQLAVILGGMVALALAFSIGLIIGIFAVPDSSDANTQQADVSMDATRHDYISQLFMNSVNPKKIEANLQHLVSKMHRAGTPEGNEVAQFIHDSLRNYGLDKVEFEDYNVLLSYPNDTSPDQVSLIDADGTATVISNGHSKMLYASEEGRSPNADVRFNAFAKAGQTTSAVYQSDLGLMGSFPSEPSGTSLDIAGSPSYFQNKLVYANYGTQDDFDYLVNKANINLTGAVVLIRYRKLWRGAKVQVAQQLGATGVLLYSDPQQETYQNETSPDATYPNTVYMPDSAVQRGTIVFRDSGDQLTPLLPSKDYVIRHDIEELYDSNLITKIPVTPISYSDAQKLLDVIDGPPVPEAWRGGLPVQYRLGPGMKSSKSVQMTVSTYPERRTIRNVIGYIKGSVEPDRYVVIGNHHDAWVYGALDPSSGTALMLEIARAFASVANSTGWRPRRTMVFCAWDAEEYGLIGSSEFIEQYLRRFETKAIAYLNVDIAVTGNETIWAKTVPLLKKALFHSAAKVPNPNPAEVQAGRKTVYDTWVYKQPDKKHPPEPWLDSIGSGSDYRHFLDFAGIASLDFRYTQAADRSYPLYHTLHETMHLVKLVDPNFTYHQAVGRMWGEMGRYLADSLLIPFAAKDYGQAMLQYIDTLNSFARNSSAASYANITYVREAGRAFMEATTDFDAKVAAATANGRYDPVHVRIINDQLMHLERMFILPFGLPGRSYLRHVVFAPSVDDTYSGVTFAGITDTMNQMAQVIQGKVQGDIAKLAVTLNDQISWMFEVPSILLPSMHQC